MGNGVYFSFTRNKMACVAYFLMFKKIDKGFIQSAKILVNNLVLPFLVEVNMDLFCDLSMFSVFLLCFMICVFLFTVVFCDLLWFPISRTPILGFYVKFYNFYRQHIMSYFLPNLTQMIFSSSLTEVIRCFIDY